MQDRTRKLTLTGIPESWILSAQQLLSRREGWSSLNGNLSLPRGAVSEFSGLEGSGKTSWLLRQFLSSQTDSKIAWIECSFQSYPLAFLQHEVRLEQVVFFEAGPQVEWVALQTLRSGVFSIAVLRDFPRESLSLRRLQLAAEKSHAAVILLQETPTTVGAWPLQKQWVWDPDAKNTSGLPWKAR